MEGGEKVPPAGLQAEIEALRLACAMLEERERRLRDFAYASGDWFWEQDASLRFTWLSQPQGGADQDVLAPRLDDPLLGRTREENAIRTPGDEAMWARYAADIAARRPFRDLTYRSRRSTDKPYWVRISGVPVFGPDGSFQGYRGVGRDVTAEMEAAEAAKRQTTLLRDTLDRLPVGIILYDADQRLIWGNATYARMAGLDREALEPGRRREEIVRAFAAAGAYGPGDPEKHVRATLAIDCSKPSRRMRRLPDGRSIDVRSEPLPDGGIVICALDVTTLIEAEAEARARAFELDTVLSRLRGGVCVYGPDRRVRLCNSRYEELIGLPTGSVRPGMTLAEVMALLRDSGEFEGIDADRHLAEALARDRSRSTRTRRVRPNGTVLDIASDPLPDGGFMITASDITALARAEDEARARAAMLDTMLDHIRHGICMFDRDGRVVSANRMAAELLLLPPDFIVPGRTQEELIGALVARGELGGGEAAKDRARAFLPDDRSVASIHRLRRSDGRVLEVRSDPTPDGGFVVTYTDVTDQTEAEERLRAAKEQAEAASRAKSQFLATMSHELRTPLNAIIGFSDALMQDPARLGAAKIAEYAASINEAGRHLLALINDILDVARIEAGRIDLSEDRVDIARLAETCRRLMEPYARTTGTTLSLALPPDLPLVRGDERRLRQVLLNLVSNAVKFSGAAGSVRIGARRAGDGGLVVTVSDNGIGIARNELERVFQPFTQLDSSLSRRFQGSGLGLYLSRALVAAHGGTLHLESPGPGLGTTAVMTLPPARVLAPPPAAAEQPARPWRTGTA